MIRIFKEKNTIWSFMIRKQLKNRFSSIGGQDNLKQAIMKDLRNQLREKNEMEEKSNKKTGPLRDEILHSELKSLVSLESNKFLEEKYSNDKYVLSKEGKVSLLYAQGCENNGKSRNILDYDPMMVCSVLLSLFLETSVSCFVPSLLKKKENQSLSWILRLIPGSSL